MHLVAPSRPPCVHDVATGAAQVEARHLTQLLHPTFADEASYRSDKKVAATGLAASPGAAVGRLVFSAADAEEWSRKVRLAPARRPLSLRAPAGRSSMAGNRKAKCVQLPATC